MAGQLFQCQHLFAFFFFFKPDCTPVVLAYRVKVQTYSVFYTSTLCVHTPVFSRTRMDSS